MAKIRMFRFGGITIQSDIKSGFLLTEKPNTDGGNVTQNSINYIDTDGAEYKDTYFAPRDFDIKGAILFNNDAGKFQLKHRLVAACNPKKEMDLFYYNGNEKFYATAMTAALPEFGEEMNGILPFCISMRIPGFYWMSEKETSCNVFERTKLLKSSFTLPIKFSMRTSETKITNSGDVDALPSFKIICNETPELSEIKINNLTTRKYIYLKYQATKGEIITIDCEKCTVKSSTKGNILNSVTADSEFFTYTPGQNDISCNLPGTAVISTHRCRYLEA